MARIDTRKHAEVALNSGVIYARIKVLMLLITIIREMIQILHSTKISGNCLRAEIARFMSILVLPKFPLFESSSVVSRKNLTAITLLMPTNLPNPSPQVNNINLFFCHYQHAESTNQVIA